MPTLTGLIAKRFIAEPNYFAIQSKTGAWRPSYGWNSETRKYDGALEPFSAQIIEKHLAGEMTIGHYLVNGDGNTKLFAFDLDFVDREVQWLKYPSATDIASLDEKFGDDLEAKNAAWEHLVSLGVRDGNPRQLWQEKKHASRPYYLRQMRGLAEMLSQRIHRELQVPVGCEISGNKGLHVYGFTGLIPASEARALALEILDSFERFEPTTQASCYQDTDENPDSGYPTLSIEVFPKQDQIREGGFGNLLALPLGVNQKAPGTKKFFIDQRTSQSTIARHPDPFALLTSGDPWSE